MIEIYRNGDLLSEGGWRPYYYAHNYKEGGGIHGSTNKQDVYREFNRINTNPHPAEQGNQFRMVKRRFVVTTSATDWEEV